MIRTISISAESLENVTDEIGELLTPQVVAGLDPNLDHAPAFPSYDLTETFELWIIDYDDLTSYSREQPAKQVPRFSGRLHHQVRQGEQVIAYARSDGSDIGKMALDQFIDSPLARAIDEAVTVLDNLEQEDPRLRDADLLVRLLVMPALQAHAFWLSGETRYSDWVLLIDGPDKFAEVSRSELLRFDSFIQLLKTLKPAAGIRPTLEFSDS